MKSRSLLIAAAASLAVTLGIAVTYSVAQIGGGFGGNIEGPNRNTSGLELIDDLPKAARQEAGRFQIVTLTSHVLLLDTSSGETWVLTESPKQEGALSWVEVPRIRPKQKGEPVKPAKANERKHSGNVDPFG